MTLALEINCPLCFSRRISVVGEPAYHTIQTVAGRDSGGETSKPYSLLCCNACKLIFKTPIVAPEILQNCYRSSPPTHWVFENNNKTIRRFQMIEQIAASAGHGNRVLDVGCSNGAMLSGWSEHWEKYGIEPSVQARDIAYTRGISILGDSVESIEQDCKFDIITVIDVIEHIPNPQSFFEKVFGILSSNGLLILYTGRTDYWWWKLVGAGYWYVSFPEHVCFYSLKTFEYIAENYGGRIAYYKPASHADLISKPGYTLQLAKNIFYFLLKKIARARTHAHYKIFQRGYPSLTQANDHLIIAIQKVG